jgi:hypothetical protein
MSNCTRDKTETRRLDATKCILCCSFATAKHLPFFHMSNSLFVPWAKFVFSVQQGFREVLHYVVNAQVRGLVSHKSCSERGRHLFTCFAAVLAIFVHVYWKSHSKYILHAERSKMTIEQQRKTMIFVHFLCMYDVIKRPRRPSEIFVNDIRTIQFPLCKLPARQRYKERQMNPTANNIKRSWPESLCGRSLAYCTQLNSFADYR